MTTAELDRIAKSPEQTIADLVAEVRRLRKLHEMWEAGILWEEREKLGKDHDVASVSGLLGMIRSEHIYEDEAKHWYKKYVIDREEF